MTAMTKRERIQAALAGKPVDRVPVSFWRHWPGDDQSEESLAAVTLQFQRTYDLDFIKLPVSSAYTVADYGVKHEYQGSTNGDRVLTGRVIKQVEDWGRIKPLNVREGVYGWHLKALRRVIEQKEKDTPVIVTMFNPLALAFYLAGEQTCLVHMRTRPELVSEGLDALTRTCTDFAQKCIKEGADGIFLSARFAGFDLMSWEEYNFFERPGDLDVLRAAAGGWFNVLHVHGQYPMVAQMADYNDNTFHKAHALNWHDRTSGLGLAEGAKLFKGAVMGGVEQSSTLLYGSPEDVEAQVKDAINQMNGQRLIIAPGCTYPVTVPHANLLAMRRGVE